MNRTRPVHVLATALALGALLTACGGGNGPTSDAAQTGPQTTTSSTSAPVQPKPSTRKVEAKTAATIAAALKLGKVRVWTAENDPNKLLGRPGMYTSSASIVDPKADCEAGNSGVDCGASVEVFATTSDAADRETYMTKALKSIGDAEYHTVVGLALLRVTSKLTPKQAAVYASKFKVAAA